MNFDKNILVIVLVVIIAVLGGLLWQANQNTQDVLPPLLDETADWNTYRNEEYGYEIEYPHNVFNSVPLSSSDNKNTVFKITEQTFINIQIGQNQERLSLINWIEQAPDEVSFDIRKYKDIIKKIKVDGKEYVQVVSMTQLQGLPMDQWIHTLILFDNQVVVISKVERDKNYNIEEIYYQMLSTFKFID